jgi:chemotaxis protein MotB
VANEQAPAGTSEAEPLPLPPKQKEPREEEEPPGAPEWVVTFTDMISLLVTFFVLLMTFSSMREHDLLRIQSIMTRNRGVIQTHKSERMVPPPQPDHVQSTHPTEGSPHPHERPFDELPDEQQSVGTAQDQRPDVNLNQIGDGLLVRFGAPERFERGSAEPNLALRRSLTQIASVLAAYEHAVVVEGHAAADHPASPDYPSALDLSVARARAVAQILVQAGLPAERVQLVAHGAQRPADVAGTPQARNANRRVELRVLALDRLTRPDASGSRGGGR